MPYRRADLMARLWWGGIAWRRLVRAARYRVALPALGARLDAVERLMIETQVTPTIAHLALKRTAGDLVGAVCMLAIL